MPIEYSIDSRTNSVFLRAWGHVSTDEVREVITRLKSDPDFQPDCKGIYDLTAVTSTDYYYAEMKQMIPCEPWGEKSERAVVVKSPMVFGLTRTYMLLADNACGKISIYYDMGKAAASLGLKLKDLPCRQEKKRPNIIGRFIDMVGRVGLEPTTR